MPPSDPVAGGAGRSTLAVAACWMLAGCAAAQDRDAERRLRTEVLGAVFAAQAARLGVEEAYAEQGRCPRDSEIHENMRIDHPRIVHAVTGDLGQGRCGVQALLGGEVQLAGKVVLLERLERDGASDWRCTSDMDPRYLSDTCLPAGDGARSAGQSP